MAAKNSIPLNATIYTPTYKYRSASAHLDGAQGQSEYSPFVRYSIAMGKWCTVTVMDGEGKRYSLDVNADSSYDAAHLYLTHVRGNPSSGFPIPTTSTLFEVVTDGGFTMCRARG